MERPRSYLPIIVLVIVAVAALVYLFARSFAQPQPVDTTSNATTTTQATSTVPAVTTSIEEYLRAHISELSPAPAVLGGTFFVTSVRQTSDTSAVVQYEDGHIALTADVKFQMTPSKGIVVEDFVIRKNDTEPPANVGILTEAAAQSIAEQSCIKGGEALGEGTYNPNSKTWWFDANLNATQPGCNPACVVSEETKQAEINWRCTGAIPPSEGTVTGHITIGPFCPVEREGVPCVVPVEAYLSRNVVVYKVDGTTVLERKALDAEGNYTIALQPGTYWLQVDPAGIGPGEKKKVTITNSTTSIVDFDIDTGIR
ncbi:MAG: carboxypeptidase regulatory-like domain-containing protein [Candidatus Pacebacteria bacterium]|nr:carboxypeptidase regulatory-like domain-containing protein [Candidatus Paceibacterota bacterium]